MYETRYKNTLHITVHLCCRISLPFRLLKGGGEGTGMASTSEFLQSSIITAGLESSHLLSTTETTYYTLNMTADSKKQVMY